MTTTTQEPDERDTDKKAPGYSNGSGTVEQRAQGSAGQDAVGSPDGTRLAEQSLASSDPGSDRDPSNNVTSDGRDDERGQYSGASILKFERTRRVQRSTVHKESNRQRRPDSSRDDSRYGQDCDTESSRGDLVQAVEEPFDVWKVEAKDLHNWWPIVRSGVEYVIEKTRPRFIAEDVFSYCRRNEAWLFVTHEKGTRKYAGCVVVGQSKAEEFVDKPEMLIWIAYSKTPGAADFTLKKVEAIAKKLGFGYIIFHSPREGWTRRAKDLGFSLRERVYQKKL